MTPIQLFDPASSTYTYVLFDTITREALIIDPVDEQIDRDLSELRARGLKLVWTVETHAHADHITSAGQTVVSSGSAKSTLVMLRYRASELPDWKSVRPQPLMSSVSPVNT